MLRKIVLLISIITLCIIGNYLSENKKSPYYSKDPFLQDTVSLREFLVDVNVVYQNQQYKHTIKVDQMSNIHYIQSAGQDYIADYQKGTLQINQNITLNIPMAKVTSIFDFLADAKSSRVIKKKKKEYVVDKDKWNQYLLDTSVNIANSVNYAYPISQEDIVVYVWKNDKYVTKINYQMNQDLQVEYTFSNFNDVNFSSNIPEVHLSNPNLYNGKEIWEFFS